MGAAVGLTIVLWYAHATSLTTCTRRHCEARSDETFQLFLVFWIASRSLSSGAHSRDPLARNDDENLSDRLEHLSTQR
jgi:hypothetical protein